MANYLCIYTVPEQHLNWLIAHPSDVEPYRRGMPSEAKDAVASPADWPIAPLEQVEMEINHRNVDLYHWLLNGSPQPVSGSGSIFQTWISDSHSAIQVDKHGDQYAFHVKQLPELLALVENITAEDLVTRLSAWLRQRGNPAKVGDDDIEGFRAEFLSLRNTLKRCIEQDEGLLWVSA